MNRTKQIRAIHKKYKLFYELFLAAVVLAIALFVGELSFRGEGGYGMNLFTEGIGIAATVFIVNRLATHREQERLKRRLIAQAGSPSNDLALSALIELRSEGWLEGKDGVLKGANLAGANLENGDLQKANLQGANLIRANLQQAQLQDTQLQGAQLNFVNLISANLCKSNLKLTTILDVNMQNAVLSKSNLEASGLFNVNLRNASLSEANLEKAKLIHTQLQDSFFINANLKYAELSQVNFRGSRYLNKAKLEGTKFYYTDLRGVDLENVSLDGNDFQMSDLREAKLRHAKLQNVNLLGCYLEGMLVSWRETIVYTCFPNSDKLPEENVVFLETLMQNITLPDGTKHEGRVKIGDLARFIFRSDPQFDETLEKSRQFVKGIILTIERLRGNRRAGV